MREIKFRGREYDTRYGLRWVYGDLTHKFVQVLVAGCIVEEATVGQYTGLRDAEGREIYEGDVIRSVMLPHMRTAVCNGCVVYRNGAFYVEYINHTYANLGDLIFYSGTSSTVIGNVHDNPNLMEAAHD